MQLFSNGRRGVLNLSSGNTIQFWQVLHYLLTRLFSEAHVIEFGVSNPEVTQLDLHFLHVVLWQIFSFIFPIISLLTNSCSFPTLTLLEYFILYFFLFFFSKTVIIERFFSLNSKKKIFLCTVQYCGHQDAIFIDQCVTFFEN